MTAPEAPKQIEQDYHYQVDQQVSVNAYFDTVIDGEAVKFQVTSRYGSSPEKIIRTTDAAIEAYKQLRGKYPLPERKPVAAMPAQNEQPVPQNGNGEKKSYEPRPVPISELPEGLPSGEYFADEFDYFVVEPQPDNKTTVKFYKDGLQYPVGALINKWKHDSVKQALAALKDIDPAKADKVRVAGRQFWTKGSEYIISKGAHAGQKSHYKDFRAAVQTF